MAGCSERPTTARPAMADFSATTRNGRTSCSALRPISITPISSSTPRARRSDRLRLRRTAGQHPHCHDERCRLGRQLQFCDVASKGRLCHRQLHALRISPEWRSASAARASPPTSKIIQCSTATPPQCNVFNFTGSSSMNNEVLYGFTAGGGVDVALTANFFLRAELEWDAIQPAARHSWQTLSPAASAPDSSSDDGR